LLDSSGAALTFTTCEVRKSVFLTNNFIVPALVVVELYRCRWQVELFFKWIKQHLRIKSFYGTSENAVKTQIWIAVSVYVLVAIVKKQMRLTDLSLYTILQILSVTLFEKAPLLEVLAASQYNTYSACTDNQMKLFDY
jgi:transposase